MYEAINFIEDYPQILDNIEAMVKPEYAPAIQTLRDKDPHDLVQPDTVFFTQYAAEGFVWTLFRWESLKLKDKAVCIKS